MSSMTRQRHLPRKDCFSAKDKLAAWLAQHCCYVCLAKVHCSPRWKSGPVYLAPAGSTRGGSGGDEWPEALREKAPIGGQRTVRAVT